MSAAPAALLAACFFLSLATCEIVRRGAVRQKLLDGINDRSLHTTPTPRLGGVGIVVATIGAAAVSWSASSPSVHALLFVGAAIAVLGLGDDVRPLPAAFRLAIQAGLAAVFLAVVGVPPLVLAPGVLVPLHPAVTAGLLALFIVGVVNIYNFMDGMDGLAGSQAVAGSVTLAVVVAPLGGVGVDLYALAVAAGSLGFLAHNAPPARIFMGDVGSTFLGMTFAGLAVIGLHRGIPIAQSALAIAPFLLDGVFTLLRRASKRERIWTAHRTHLYQRAVQTGLGHREVLLVYLGWIAICSVGAILASDGWVALVVGWTAAVAGLVVVWRWVVRRESERAQLA